MFNGRAGLEMIEGLRAGCAGFILAPDCIDHAVRIYEHFRAGEQAEAEAIYAAVLPSITFVMQGLEHLICYGKRLFTTRAGLSAFDRAPAQRPTEFGLSLLEDHARRLGRFQA